MNQKRVKRTWVLLAGILFLGLLATIVLAVTGAWFVDKEETRVSLSFGNITVSSNNEGGNAYFSSKSITVKPGDNIFEEDVKFNLGETSNSCYIRGKYAVSSVGTLNSDEKILYNYLKYKNLNLNTVSGEYSWSKKIGDYYYLLDASGNPLKVSAVRSSDYVFITKTGNEISTSLSYDATKISSGAIKVEVGLEAVQTANVGDATIANVSAKLNEALNVTTPTDKYTVTIKGVSGTNETTLQTISNIAYGGDASITTASAQSSSGYALSSDGMKIILPNENGHTYLENNTLKNVTENLTLYAQTATVETYTVNFKNGNTTIYSTTVNGGEYASCTLTPTKDEDNAHVYYFIGWVKEGTTDLVNLPETAITANTNFVAIFYGEIKEVKVYFKSDANTKLCETNAGIVTYNSSDEEIENTSYYPLKDSSGNPLDPTKEGCRFVGWKIDGTGTAYATSNLPALSTLTPTNNTITFIAEWGEVLIVTFDAQQGVCAVTESSFVVGYAYGTLPTPTKVGYTFVGWFTEANGNGTKVESTAVVTATEALTLYAQWIEQESYLSKDWKTRIKNANSLIAASTIKSITFTNTVPTGYTGSVSVGTNSETDTTAYTTSTTIADVMAYYKENSETSGTYDIVIYSPVKIYAPTNSSSLFSCYVYSSSFISQLTEINFGTNFDTSKVTSMNYMFSYCSSLTNLTFGTNFDTSKVTNMSDMFRSCSKLTSLDLSNFNTSNVTVMYEMFSYCSSLTNLTFGTNFNTSKVTSMSEMFYNCSKLTTLDLSNFDTSSVESMENMFRGCSKLTSLDLSNFDTSSVDSMEDMFCGCSKLTSLDLSNFNTSSVRFMDSMFFSCSSLTSLTFGTNFNTSNVRFMDSMFYNCSSLTSLTFGTNFNTSKVTTMYEMFRYCSSLTSLTFGTNFNTSSVTNMSCMFDNCSKLTTLDLNNFNTSSVTDMGSMFSSCSSLTALDLSNFNTSSVTDMGSMFSSCSKLTTLNLSNFNTSSVTTMEDMFYKCSSLTSLTFGTNFNTSKVTTMYEMFYNCSKLTTLDVSNFNTSSVTTMYLMFAGCSSLTSLTFGTNFNTSKVTTMYGMFHSCSTLTTLDLSSFDMTKVTKVTSMLTGCTSLTSIIAPYNVPSSYSISLPATFTNGTTSATQITSSNGLASTETNKVTLTKVS